MDLCKLTALRCACEYFRFLLIFLVLQPIQILMIQFALNLKMNSLSDSYVTADPKDYANSMGLRTENLFTIPKLMNKYLNIALNFLIITNSNSSQDLFQRNFGNEICFFLSYFQVLCFFIFPFVTVHELSWNLGNDSIYALNSYLLSK